MMTLNSLYMEVLRELKKNFNKVDPDITQPGGFAGGIQQKLTPQQTDSGWKYRGGFAGLSKGDKESDLPNDDEDGFNKYSKIKGNS